MVKEANPMETIYDWTVLNEGDIVYENDAGQSIKVRVATPVRRYYNYQERAYQESFMGEVGGQYIEMMHTDKSKHYGPQLSRQPQYHLVELSDYLDFDSEG